MTGAAKASNEIIPIDLYIICNFLSLPKLIVRHTECTYMMYDR